MHTSQSTGRPSLAQRIRAIANWLNLSTPLGLAIASSGGGILRRGPDALWVAEGYMWPFPKVGAFTVGSVVIVPRDSLDAIVARHPDLIEHERRHANQWALCLGLPFLPLYAVATAWSHWRTGTAHGANVFEIAASLSKGGYQPAPLRSLRRRHQAKRI